jgi:hypothetical protein
MEFVPKSDDELKAERLLPEGVYDFEVTLAEETISRKGAAMLAVRLRVFSPNGNTIEQRDWLLLEGTMGWKFKRFCEAIGKLDDYNQGKLDVDTLTGCAGKLKLVRKDDPEFGPQNRVAGYGEPQKKEQPKGKLSDLAVGGKPKPPMDDDDIPF